MAGVDDEIDAFADFLGDVVGITERYIVVRQHEGAGEDGFAQGFEQRLRDGMIRHTQTDGGSFGVQGATRHFFGRRQNEGVRARRELFEQAILLIIHARVLPQFGQVVADQCEMVREFDLANL